MNEPVQPQTPQKKGLSPLAWIAIGCVGLILLTGLLFTVGMFWVGKKAVEMGEEMMENPAKSMAEMAIKMNPDTKFISSDDETVTFKTKDGEVVTMNFEDIQSGNFSMTTEEGETSSFSFGERGITGTTKGEDGEETEFSLFGGGSDTSNVPDQVKYPGATSMTTTMASRGRGKWEGMIGYETGSTLDEVVDWQSGALDDCEVTRTDIGDMRTATISCGEDSVNLMFMGQDGSLQVTATYDIRE